jgi:hypothetical protein
MINWIISFVVFIIILALIFQGQAIGAAAGKLQKREMAGVFVIGSYLFATILVLYTFAHMPGGKELSARIFGTGSGVMFALTETAYKSNWVGLAVVVLIIFGGISSIYALQQYKDIIQNMQDITDKQEFDEANKGAWMKHTFKPTVRWPKDQWLPPPGEGWHNTFFIISNVATMLYFVFAAIFIYNFYQRVVVKNPNRWRIGS